MMYKEDRISQPIAINEPVQFQYLARGRTYIKLRLPKDTTYQVGCYGETFKPYTGFPMQHVTAYLDPVALRMTKINVEGEDVVDLDCQRRLPCHWNEGQCRAEGITYLWNVTDPQYCPVAVVKEFQGQQVEANASSSPDTRNVCEVQAIVSADGVEKIRVHNEGQASQCG